jgi:hypothetical protein
MASLKDLCLFVRGTGLMNQCWMEYLGLHNKPKAAVHPEILQTGPFKNKRGSTSPSLPRIVYHKVGTRGKSHKIWTEIFNDNGTHTPVNIYIWLYAIKSLDW